MQSDTRFEPKLRGDVYVCCTANLVTGGPELLHQLVHEINRLGGNAKIAYVPLHRTWETPPAYLHYQCPVASAIPDAPSTVVIVPEVMTALLRKFQHAHLVVWWLSVDNYTNPTGHWIAPLVRFRRKLTNDWHRSDELVHLAQSHYARDFVWRRFGVQAAMLGDYIDPCFFEPLLSEYRIRKRRIAFNPKKGAEYTVKLRAAMPDIQFIALENMTRDQVIDCLRDSMLYLDLGHHPGKDRIPREAAACGCVVVVANRGSARFFEDVPLHDYYKIDVASGTWVADAASVLRDVLANWSAHLRQQREFFEIICRERAEFTRAVTALFF